MSRICRACGKTNTSRFPSLCGTCGVRSLEWNKQQPHHVPNGWPYHLSDGAAWDWNDELQGMDVPMGR